MSNSIPKMITLLEAAECSGLSYDYLRKRCLDGTLVHIRSGRKFLINSNKLADYLNDGSCAKAVDDSDKGGAIDV